MNISKVPSGKITALAYKDLYYQENYSKLGNFINFQPTLEGLKKAVEERKKYPVNRKILTEVLNENYSDIDVSELQKENLKNLESEDTFTIITAHQPSLAGGPAYYFYKIYSTIHLTRLLKKEMPQYNFVPVFINGAEDHDYDEIKSVDFFGKTITWETNQGGAVGRFNTEGLKKIFDNISEILGGSEKAQKISKIWSDALSKTQIYTEFVFRWVNEFFKEYGLIVVNMDDHRLKKSFSSIIKKELVEKISEPLVLATQEALTDHGFKPQAFARDINLFYLGDNSRERIYFEDGFYKINNTDLKYTQGEIIQILDDHPEKFSPNVVIRPLYQEFTLPNLAYIGGGGELAYWLERKTQFEAFGIFFPTLIRRNSVMIVPKNLQRMMEKLSLTEDDILLEENELINYYLEKVTEQDFHLKSESKEILGIFHKIAEKAKNIDPTLEAAVLGEAHKSIKTVENLEGRLKRSIKQREEVQVNQIKTLKSKLFPNNGLQERNDSFIQFWIDKNNDMDQVMLENLNPLDNRFIIMYS